PAPIYTLSLHDALPIWPFAAHPAAHVWGSRSHDPSLPSDHASAAFAIAFAVFLFDRVIGSVFLAAAAVIGVGRVFIGAHYPLDRSEEHTSELQSRFDLV